LAPSVGSGSILGLFPAGFVDSAKWFHCLAGLKKLAAGAAWAASFGR